MNTFCNSICDLISACFIGLGTSACSHSRLSPEENFLFAAATDDVAAVERYLASPNNDPTVVDETGLVAMHTLGLTHLCDDQCSAPVMEDPLREYGLCDIRCSSRMNALQFACLKPAHAVMDILLRNPRTQILLNKRNAAGESALHVAAFFHQNCAEIIGKLLKAGADPRLLAWK